MSWGDVVKNCDKNELSDPRTVLRRPYPPHNLYWGYLNLVMNSIFAGKVGGLHFAGSTVRPMTEVVPGSLLIHLQQC